MASHISSSKKVFTFIVTTITIVHFALRASSAVAAADGSPNGGDLVSEACSRTSHFEVFVASLRSDPHTDTTVDLEGLAAIALDQSIAHSEQTLTVVADALRANDSSGDDQSPWRRLSDCEEEYTDKVENLKESAQARKEREFDTVNSLVSAATTDSDTCEDGLKEMTIYDSPWSERNERFFKLCSNFLAISRL